MCTFWSSFPVLAATVTKPNIRRKTNPNVFYRKAFLSKKGCGYRSTVLSSVPFSTPFLGNLGTCSWKLSPQYDMVQHKLSSQAAQYAWCKANEHFGSFSNQFRSTVQSSPAQLNKSFCHFSAFIPTQKLTERIKLKV